MMDGESDSSLEYEHTDTDTHCTADIHHIYTVSPTDS